METQYVSLDVAASQIGVRKATLYHYIKTLGLETKKYPLDRRAYMLVGDIQKIKKLRDEAQVRNEQAQPCR